MHVKTIYACTKARDDGPNTGSLRLSETPWSSTKIKALSSMSTLLQCHIYISTPSSTYKYESLLQAHAQDAQFCHAYMLVHISIRIQTQRILLTCMILLSLKVSCTCTHHIAQIHRQDSKKAQAQAKLCMDSTKGYYVCICKHVVVRRSHIHTYILVDKIQTRFKNVKFTYAPRCN